MRTAIVTDSTACLPTDLVAGSGVTVVPLHVVVDGRDHLEGVDIDSAQVAAALGRGARVSTSLPSPEEFAHVYRQLAGRGYDQVVSVHISGDLSGTVGAARQAASGASLPVHVVDSRTLGMAMGYPVLRAAALAREGEDPEVIAEQCRWECTTSKAAVYVDTLEFLGKGGRLGKAAVFMGTALSIKPLLTLRNGVLAPLEKIRTSSKALSRLADRAVGLAESLPGWATAVDVAVHHLGAEERATAVLADIVARVPHLGQRRVVELGAVVGAHVGPGAVAVALSPFAARAEDSVSGEAGPDADLD